jgi:hypothetical protein
VAGLASGGAAMSVLARIDGKWLREAARRGKICGGCGRELGESAPIWRKQFTHGRGYFGGATTIIAPICEACWQAAEDANNDAVWSHGPCENCQRPVYESQRRKRRHHYCCEDCREKHQLLAIHALARQRRTEARGSSRPCQECGERFEPARADAKFCSARCKQKAWRRTLRLSKDGHCPPFGSRNAVERGRR